MTKRERQLLMPFLRFVEARTHEWKGKSPDNAFYGKKYPGANLKLIDFLNLAEMVRGDNVKK